MRTASVWSSQAASWRFAIHCGFLWCVLTTPAVAAETHTLVEPVTDDRIFSIQTRLEVNGDLQTAAGDGKAIGLSLNVKGKLDYRERRLPGTGRNAAALRTLRYYDAAEATINVSRQTTFSRLREQRKLIVAQGRRQGVELYSPSGPMTYSELDLLRTPGDSLAIMALLPRTDVEVGATWEPESWAMQMLPNIEAVLESELTCRLESADQREAKVTFSGKIEGAIAGAATTVALSGHYVYDLKARHIRRIELRQTEERSVGTVSPGMKVTATVTVERTPVDKAGELNDGIVRQIPLDPPAEWLLLYFDSPWNMGFHYDRGWHVFHQTADVAVLRLLEHGSLIAQCNVSPVPSARPGEHTPVEKFQLDVQQALGENLKSIEKTEELSMDNDVFVYRVVAVGEANGVPMEWHYYLCAAPSGRQVSFVFATEAKTLERLADRDLQIIRNLKFSPARQISGAGR